MTTAAADQDSVTGLFRGEVAQVRVWSSPCSEASLHRLLGRAGVLEGEAALVCLWKADEGAGNVLRNSRPLHRPKPARGSKAVAGSGGTGAEGHAELVGEWEWVSCFDPDDYDSVAAIEEATPAAPESAADAGALPPSCSPSARRLGRRGETEFAPLVVAGSGSAEAAAAAAESPTARTSDTDLARSLGWRSVSTAGDEEEEEEEDGRDERHRREDERVKSSSACAEAGGAVARAATIAGASAALGGCAVLGRAGVGNVCAREALLGILGKLYQQCSVYLAPCQGNPLVESTPPPRGGRIEARVQLQRLRREERALKAVVQPEVCLTRVCPGVRVCVDFVAGHVLCIFPLLACWIVTFGAK